MEDLFEKYNSELEKQQTVLDSIREHVRSMQNVARLATFNRNKLHSILDKGVDEHESLVNDEWVEFVQKTLPSGESPFASRPELIRFAEHSLARLCELKPIWSALEAAVTSSGNVEQFRDMWRFTVGEIMASVAVFVYIARGKSPFFIYINLFDTKAHVSLTSTPLLCGSLQAPLFPARNRTR